MTQGAGGWLSRKRPSGEDYDRDLAARLTGRSAHGEADFVENLATQLFGRLPTSVLDAGCGTGRVAVELARRGFSVTGVDIDPGMLDAARLKDPAVSWILGDLTTVEVARTFSVILMAGNVMLFVGRGNEPAVVDNLARHLTPDGVLVAGFQLGSGALSLAEYDELCAATGLTLVERWATWEQAPWSADSMYAVSAHGRQTHLGGS